MSSSFAFEGIQVKLVLLSKEVRYSAVVVKPEKWVEVILVLVSPRLIVQCIDSAGQVVLSSTNTQVLYDQLPNFIVSIEVFGIQLQMSIQCRQCLLSLAVH